MPTGSYDHAVDAAHRRKSAEQLQLLNPAALKGITNARANLLSDALGVDSIGELADNRFVKTAIAILQDSVDIGHDPGPDNQWTALFKAAPLSTYQQHPSSFRLDFGPSYYRGRLNGTARVLIVGQDPAANELIGHRAFVGKSGQRVQAFLRRLGITRDYLMVNTFLYPVFGQFFGDLRRLTEDPEIMGFRHRLFDFAAKRNKLETVIAVGAAGRDAVNRWPGSANLNVENITHPSAHDHAALLANWNDALARLRTVVEPESQALLDQTNFGTDFTDEDHQDIPRFDLPFGVPEWHGVGSRARRGRNDDGSTNHKELIWKAP